MTTAVDLDAEPQIKQTHKERSVNKLPEGKKCLRNSDNVEANNWDYFSYKYYIDTVLARSKTPL